MTSLLERAAGRGPLSEKRDALRNVLAGSAREEEPGMDVDGHVATADEEARTMASSSSTRGAAMEVDEQEVRQAEQARKDADPYVRLRRERVAKQKAEDAMRQGKFRNTVELHERAQRHKEGWLHPDDFAPNPYEQLRRDQERRKQKQTQNRQITELTERLVAEFHLLAGEPAPPQPPYGLLGWDSCSPDTWQHWGALWNDVRTRSKAAYLLLLVHGIRASSPGAHSLTADKVMAAPDFAAYQMFEAQIIKYYEQKVEENEEGARLFAPSEQQEWKEIARLRAEKADWQQRYEKLRASVQQLGQ